MFFYYIPKLLNGTAKPVKDVMLWQRVALSLMNSSALTKPLLTFWGKQTNRHTSSRITSSLTLHYTVSFHYTEVTLLSCTTKGFTGISTYPYIPHSIPLWFVIQMGHFMQRYNLQRYRKDMLLCLFIGIQWDRWRPLLWRKNFTVQMVLCILLEKPQNTPIKALGGLPCQPPICRMPSVQLSGAADPGSGWPQSPLEAVVGVFHSLPGRM